MRRMIAAVCVLCSSLVWAQTQEIEANVRREAAPQEERKAPLSKKAAAEKKQQEERGLQLLQVAEAQAAGLEGGMRAYALWQLARTYQRTDKAKALELLEGAMTASRDMEEDGGRARTRSQLQQDILRDMVALAPQRAEELLIEVPADRREPVLNALLGFYEKNKDFDHAMELVYRIGQEKEIPYGAAARIMTALPPERSGDLLQLFTIAFASYRDHPHGKGVFVGGGDFSALIEQFWQKLPANLVHDAISEVLKQASEQKDTNNIAVSSEQGTASFNSYYEYALFRLAPVLRHIDESEADALLKKNQEAKELLAKYPGGMGSLMPAATAAPEAARKSEGAKPGTKPSLGTSMSVSSGGGSMRGAESMMLQQQQANRILTEADEHPENALTQAAAISDANIRAGVYQAIASSAAKKKPSTARSALDKLLATTEQADEMQQIHWLRSAAELYLLMGEADDAKKVVERGFKLADKLQAKDTNADDPNKALKAYWPSAEAWRGFTRLAGQISPAWAMTQVSEIADADMKVMAQTALAQQWLDVSRGSITVMSATKNGNMMMRSNDERQQ